MTDDTTTTVSPTLLDTTVPHSARVYDYWLGGKDNFSADRAVGDAMIHAAPGIRAMTWQNRLFTHRVARHMLDEGIRQFLDIGAGIPRSPNLHEITQRIDPSCRIAYVDNDPLVLTHIRALMLSHPDGRIADLRADLREPATILTAPALHDTLDLTRPVGVTLTAVLMQLTDTDDPWTAVAQLRDALPSGSCLAITHPTADFNPHEMTTAVDAATTAGMTLVARTRAAVEEFFGDWQLLEPSVVPVSAWRPDEPVDNPHAAYYWAGLARKQ
ncbi:SAM-dependent methyltransferase [Actinoplanes sp. NPDC026670]|uniref:SAM-dependent methyltransferase n=1 Tax=Actinoplanes sp. NPDC026670 TaxID=3154700 RepID=UPI0033EC4E06